uniref:Uncharacterized protein n=1 Tax=Arundo donax TaxID=35708 RepID=A0A0A9BEI6_ARUDO
MPRRPSFRRMSGAMSAGPWWSPGRRCWCPAASSCSLILTSSMGDRMSVCSAPVPTPARTTLV